MIKGKVLFLLGVAAVFSACNSGSENTETRTSGTVDILVDETFAPVVDAQIDIFKDDYPEAKFNVIAGTEKKLVTTFLNDSVRVIVLSRMLTSEEQKGYLNKGIQIQTSRFAIDGIALISNAEDGDSTINAQEVIDIMQGKSDGGKNLVFDNAYSSTIRYFMSMAKINSLPEKGVYTLKTNNDVISYVASNKNYIGVLGVNWLLPSNEKMADAITKVKIMGVKNLPGKKGDDKFYKPEQTNLINGIYPFLRNVYIMNGEGRNGLGTGFASWLNSARGQLIVLKSGLGPHKMNPREINLINTN